MSEILCSCGSNLEEFSLLECDTVWFSRNKCTNVLDEHAASIFKVKVTPLPGHMVSLYRRQFLKRVLCGFMSPCQYWQPTRATVHIHIILILFFSYLCPVMAQVVSCWSESVGAPVQSQAIPQTERHWLSPCHYHSTSAACSIIHLLTLRLLMSYIYIYMEHLFLMFLDHTRRRSTVGRTPLDE